MAFNDNRGISVIVCTYNGAGRLPHTLRHLAEQQFHTPIKWEIIVVNNASTDDTVETTKREWQKYNLIDVSFRVIDQPKPGKTFAFEKGVEESRYDYILICDDDNWLSPQYVQRIYDLFEEEDYDLIGGWGVAVCEIDAPAWFTQLNGYGYAVGKEGYKTGPVKFLYGAGMGIKKKDVLQVILNPECEFLLAGRIGKNLVAGEDTELCLICDNKKIHFDEELVFQHHITRKRLSWRYYLRLRKSFGVANSFLTAYNFEKAAYTKQQIFYYYLIQLFRAIKAARKVKYLMFPNRYQDEYCAGYFENLGFIQGAIANLRKINRNVRIAKRNRRVASQAAACV